MKRIKGHFVLLGLISLMAGCSPNDENSDDYEYQLQLNVFHREYVKEERRAEALHKLAFEFAVRDGVAELVIATSQDKSEPEMVRAKAFECIDNFQTEHPEVFDLLEEAAADKAEPVQVRTTVLTALSYVMSRRSGLPAFFMRIAQDTAESSEVRSDAIHHIAWSCPEHPAGFYDLLLQTVEDKGEPVQVRFVASFCITIKYAEEPEVIAWAERAATDDSEEEAVRRNAESFLNTR